LYPNLTAEKNLANPVSKNTLSATCLKTNGGRRPVVKVVPQIFIPSFNPILKFHDIFPGHTHELFEMCQYK
jgi:hypothetical protein